jgi:hypothetical protein
LIIVGTFNNLNDAIEAKNIAAIFTFMNRIRELPHLVNKKYKSSKR